MGRRESSRHLGVGASHECKSAPICGTSPKRHDVTRAGLRDAFRRWCRKNRIGGMRFKAHPPYSNWRARRESNPHSLGSKPSALSIKLRAHGLIIPRVVRTRLEDLL